ncbi:MAG: type II restriction enzyme [Nanoarchaeota archaeon]
MAKNRGRKVDKQWENIFEDYPILQEIERKGLYHITSTEINNYREARLMTKFDHRDNLPYIFSENNLRILPITRGEYVIGNFEVYQDIDLDYDNLNFQEVSFPNWIESINPKNLYSETAALKGAFISGIINDITERDKIISTVGGRMSTKSFDFNINSVQNKNTQKIKVKNSQCEIDGGYETEDKFILIEAKNSFSKDFLVRQLYYPYRLWNKKLNKDVVPIFMIYSNDIYSFFVYEFEDPNHYNSLRLIKQKNYVIKDRKINIEDIKRVYDEIKIKQEPEEPFPQANTFVRVLDLLQALYIDNLDIEDISTRYDFDIRQASYYTAAAKYLNLVKSDNGNFKLTKKGQKIMELNKRERNLLLVRSILEHEIFYKAFKLFLKPGEVKVEDVAQMMIKNIDKIYNVSSKNTVKRRASTVFRWIKWILNLPDKT